MNHLSFDFSAGYNRPFTPYQKKYNSAFSGLKHLELGVRYMFTEKMGLRLNYANDNFRNDSGGDFGTNFSRIGIDAVYNIGKALNLDLISRYQYGLLGHAGIGYTRVKPIYQKKSEQVGAVVLGLTPQIKLSDEFAFFGDLSLDVNFKQHYRYDGSLYTADYDPIVGSHMTASLGIVMYLGQNKYHADWY